jgi:hypothetical protein
MKPLTPGTPVTLANYLNMTYAEATVVRATEDRNTYLVKLHATGEEVLWPVPEGLLSNTGDKDHFSMREDPTAVLLG